jgi:hypothetical protein
MILFIILQLQLKRLQYTEIVDTVKELEDWNLHIIYQEIVTYQCLSIKTVLVPMLVFLYFRNRTIGSGEDIADEYLFRSIVGFRYCSEIVRSIITTLVRSYRKGLGIRWSLVINHRLVRRWDMSID